MEQCTQQCKSSHYCKCIRNIYQNDHIIGQNLLLFEFIQSIYSDHSGIELRINKKMLLPIPIWGNSATPFQKKPLNLGINLKLTKYCEIMIIKIDNNDNKHKIMI